MNSLAFIGSRLFSLRLLIVVLALACVFVGDALPLLGWLDRVLFSALGNPEGIGDAVRVVDMTPDAFAIALQARGLVEPEWCRHSSWYLQFPEWVERSRCRCCY